MVHRLGLVALALGVLVLAPRPADACGALKWELQVLLPPADAKAMPRDGALLAVVIAPNGQEEEVTLTRVDDGSAVPLTIDLTPNGANEEALLQVVAAEPLEPNAEYVWSVGGVEQTFFTHEGFDAAFPSSGPLVINELGEGTGGGCFDGTPYADYEIVITEVSEPVASYAVLPGDDHVVRFVAGQGPTIAIRVYGDGVQCWDLMIADHGGHVANAGTACLAGPGVGAGSSTGGDETAGDETGPPMSTSTTATDESGSAGSGQETGSTPQDGDPTVDRGCACRAQSGPGRPGTMALGWLLLAALGVHRRRAHRTRRPPRPRDEA